MDIAAKMECSKMASPGKPRISVVWKYFKMDSEDKSKVVCQICEEQLKFSGSTTSMKYHLSRHSALISLNIALPPSKSKHGNGGGGGGGSKAGGGLGFKPSVAQLECGGGGGAADGRQDAVTANLVNMCLMDLVPTTVADGQGFRQLMRYMEPGYAVPSHQALNRRIASLYDSRKRRLLSELRRLPDVTLSVERWAAAGGAVFLTVTAHYITADWDFQSRVLGSELLTESPTAEAVADIVSSAVRGYGIGDAAVVAVIHANDQEVARSYALLGWHHFPCFARTLGHCVAVALALPAVAALVAACRDVVDCVRGCPTLAANIEARLKAEGAARRRFLADAGLSFDDKQWCYGGAGAAAAAAATDGGGHWPATFRMMEAVHEERRVVFEVMKETLELDTFPKPLLRSDQEWERVGAVVEALRPLETVREMLSAEPHVSLSTVVPVLFSLVSVHLRPDAADAEVVQNLKQVLVREMKSQFSFDSSAFPESFGIMTTVLDPRHKSLPFLNELQRNIVKTKLATLVEENRAAAAAAAAQGAAEDEDGAAVANYGDDSDEDDGPVAVKRPKPTVAEFLSPIYDRGGGGIDAGGAEARTRGEVEAYLQEMAASLASNPLTWWKLCGYKYPSLSKLARRMLCIPATAVPPAQAFSGAADPERRKRAALDPAVADKMLFLNRNAAPGELRVDEAATAALPPSPLEDGVSCFPQMALLSPDVLAETMQGVGAPP